MRKLFLALLGILGAQGCTPVGAYRISGGHNEQAPRGFLSTLTIENPDGKTVIAVKVPKPLDREFSGMGGGNSSDVSEWEQHYNFRLEGEENNVAVTWRFSSRTRKLQCRGEEAIVPRDRIAVVTLDGNLKPRIELREFSKESVEQIKRELGMYDESELLPRRPTIDKR